MARHRSVLYINFVSLLLCYFVGSVSCENRALQTTSYLYDAIRRIAFPTSPKLDEDQTDVDNRFILMMPGKVLNYFDYYPGPEYTDFIQNPDNEGEFAIVPPHTMEKWFDLADVVPSANPLSGQDTGKSLANIYRQILEQTTIRNIKEQSEQVLGLYNRAVGYLYEEVSDPRDLSRRTTRLALYDKYKEEYNELKLEMEEEIEMKRQSLQSIDYELWFQRHYPLLSSKVESAYVRWLIMGQKEMCDIYLTYLDTGASAKALEEARIVLRSSGSIAMDRTRTIYPVDFEPSDWYKYLLPPTQERPSSAELQEVLSRINAKIASTDDIINFYQTRNEKLDNFTTLLERIRDSKAAERNSTLSSYLKKKLECSIQNSGVGTGGNSCEVMTGLSHNITTQSNDQAISTANAEEYYKWAPGRKVTFIKSLRVQKEELMRQRQLIQASLGKVDPLVGGILNMDSLAVASLIDSHKDDQWMQFQFDSEEYRRDTNFESTTKSTEVSVSVGVPFFNIGYSHTDSKTNEAYQDSVAQASLKAKGKLLRVFIKRPWFKPELFDDRNLNFVDNTATGAKVLGAPGKSLSEKDFIDAITVEKGGPNDVIYRLPEYVTSFLLARDVELEFSNLNKETFRNTMSSVTQHAVTGNFLAFSANFAHTNANSNTASKVHRTANGMKIVIPGAQVIGYYTQKLPKFPATSTK